MIKLVTLLGNPGSKYKKTRHNAGWMIAEYLPFLPDWQKKFKGSYAKIFFTKDPLILLKPETYMNSCGESVLSCMQFFRLQPEELLVVHDDIELPFGEVKIKEGGGLGGHNGLRSISSLLGSNHFFRLRIGVSRPTRGDVSTFVLSRFSHQEEAELPFILKKASEMLTEILSEKQAGNPKA